MEKNYRCCVSCRHINHRQFLWRVVRQFPTHRISLNQGTGRSAYLCPSEKCIKNAQKKNRLGRVLKAPIPPGVYDELLKCLEQSSLD